MPEYFAYRSMDIKIYNDIVRTIRNHHGLTTACFPLLRNKFPSINKNSLTSILTHEYQKRMKCNHIKTPEIMNTYYNLYKEALDRGDHSGIILRISQMYDVTPCLVAKLILQKHLTLVNSTYTENEGSVHQNVKMCLRDTTLIQDPMLAYEVFLCTVYDVFYSPIAETMRKSLGQEYEIKLYKEISDLGLAFRDEEHLRKYGYDKTPDVKLEVPIAVDGFVINWVESKALFGDEYVHKDYMHHQYLSYWNRFGPGLVIYWFGFIETLLQPNDKRFIIKDHFPKSNITHIVEPKGFMDSAKN